MTGRELIIELIKNDDINFDKSWNGIDTIEATLGGFDNGKVIYV